MKPAIDQLATKGEVEYGWLGVYVSDVPNSLGAENGAWVSNIFINSPASLGGLLPGDIVTSINGQPVIGANDLTRIVGNTSPGDNLRMSLVRDGQRLEKRIRIDRRNSEADLATMQERVWPGLIVAIDNDGNLRVAGLIPNSPSEVSGIQPGDIIIKVNGTEIGSIVEYSRALSAANPDDELRFRINRNGTQLIIGLLPAK
jgi:serine protease Do